MKWRTSNTLRIVSLAPSATSILCAIGARKSLVGVTKWCADVAPVNGLPKLGDCWHMDSVGEILKLKPALVIGSVPYKQETLAKLLEHPLSFLATNPRSLADIESDIRILGGIAGRATQAEHLIRKMRVEFDSIAKMSRTAKNKLRVYCEAWPNPRISSPALGRRDSEHLRRRNGRSGRSKSKRRASSGRAAGRDRARLGRHGKSR